MGKVQEYPPHYSARPSFYDEARGVVNEVSEKLRDTPDMVDVTMLYRIGLQVACYLPTIGTQEIRSESEYKKIRQALRQTCSSVADTDLNAEASEEFLVWRQWRKLHDDMVEISRTIRRLADIVQEDKRNTPMM